MQTARSQNESKSRRERDLTTVTSKDSVQAYLQAIRRHNVLSREDEEVLARRYVDDGDEAAAMTLINSNLRLVVKIANEYNTPKVDLLDLIQEGNLGLLRAVRRFDPTRGVRLSSYAQWWIRAYILKYLMDNHRLVKLGTTQAQRKLYYNLNKAREALRRQGDQPSPEAIANYLGVRERDVIEMQRRMDQRDVRLNAPVDEDGATERGDLMSNDEMPPDEVVASKEFWHLFKAKLREFSSNLKGRDVLIWQERLLNDEPLTLRELAGKFGVSRERVRQLEARIVRKLDAYVRSELKSP